MAKSFKRFIADAREEAKLGEYDKIGKLYTVLSKNDWTIPELNTLIDGILDEHGKPKYELKPKDITHLDILHEKTCERWQLEDTDY